MQVAALTGLREMLECLLPGLSTRQSARGGRPIYRYTLQSRVPRSVSVSSLKTIRVGGQPYDSRSHATRSPVDAENAVTVRSAPGTRNLQPVSFPVGFRVFQKTNSLSPRRRLALRPRFWENVGLEKEQSAVNYWRPVFSLKIGSAEASCSLPAAIKRGLLSGSSLEPGTRSLTLAAPIFRVQKNLRKGLPQPPITGF